MSTDFPRMMLTLEECRQVAARIALAHGAQMNHTLVREIDDLIADVVIGAALGRNAGCADFPARTDISGNGEKQ